MAVMQLFLLNEFVNQSRISQLEYMTDYKLFKGL